MLQLSRFEQEALVLPFPPEISRFDTNKSMTWKSWLLATKLGVCVLLLTAIFIAISRSVSTKARIALALAKEATGTSVRINKVCSFLTMKSAVELFLKFLLLCQTDIQEMFWWRQSKIQLF